MVADDIARLDRWLAAKRPDYYAQLQPGADAAALDAFERRFGVELPAAFRALYGWRNGQRPDCYESLQDNRMFAALDEIADTKAMLDDMIGSDFDDPRWWRRA